MSSGRHTNIQVFINYFYVTVSASIQHHRDTALIFVEALKLLDTLFDIDNTATTNPIYS
jgi:hypothetical protein